MSNSFNSVKKKCTTNLVHSIIGKFNTKSTLREVRIVFRNGNTEDLFCRASLKFIMILLPINIAILKLHYDVWCSFSGNIWLEVACFHSHRRLCFYFLLDDLLTVFSEKHHRLLWLIQKRPEENSIIEKPCILNYDNLCLLQKSLLKVMFIYWEYVEQS